jgi:hypothetical protein
MPDTFLTWSWLSLIALGSFHGLNPAMGWLFAVDLGMQQKSERAVVSALGPIAAGHALSIAAVVLVAWALGTLLPEAALLIAGGLSMVAFAGWKVVRRFRHPAWVGMRVGPGELLIWSFVMASAHGAGLMLLPPLLALRSSTVPAVAANGGHHAHHLPEAGSGQSDLMVAFLALGLHTLALFVVSGVIALVVYRKVGVDILRRAWINLDVVWVGALGVAGGLTLAAGCWMLRP